METGSITEKLYGTVFDALDQGAIVVTANQRAARTLGLAFDRHKLKSGLKSWRPATVLAWESWTADLWRSLIVEGHITALLLNRTQEHFLWRSIIESDPERQQVLRSVDSLAGLASEAWTLMHRYEGADRLKRFAATTEAVTFARWAHEFGRLCRAREWLSTAVLEHALRRHVMELTKLLPHRLLLAGFDEIYPSRARFVEAIRQAGCIIEEVDLRQHPDERLLVEGADETDEISAAAQYFKARMQRFPGESLALVVPDLLNRRAAIDRQFRKILSPELENVAAPDHTEPYEFSIGAKLSETQLVRVALEFLRWVHSPLPIERVGRLLLSPFFAGSAGEMNARALFDAFELRKVRVLRPEITIRSLLEMAMRSSRRSMLPSLLGCLQRLGLAVTKYKIGNSQRSYSEWSEIVRLLLQEAGWGVLTGADSIEHQMLRRWEAALDELSALSFDGSLVGYAQILEALVWIADQMIFAPESRNTPVQILGPLETSGSVFDTIWFAGAGDLTWPSAVTSNPLLPWALQTELGMKGMNTRADDESNQRIVSRIASSATSVIFSYAIRVDEARQRLSPVFAYLSLQPIALESLAPKEKATPPEVLEEIVESPLAPVPDRDTVGGVNILALQAACGFRAFAEKRVAAAELESPGLGMNARERGSIIHRTLQFFWDDVRTQDALKSMSEEQRQEILDGSIDRALVQFLRLRESSWENAYLDVQARRLKRLLGSWLSIELKRPNFEVLYSERDFEKAQIGPLKIHVRLDRVDSAEGGKVLIDYKTGKANSSSWMGARPDAPQLPFYAVLSQSVDPETAIAEVAFANIHSGKDAAFEGYVSKITSKGSRSQRRDLTIKEQIEQWKMVLDDLAQQFYAGEISVNPKQYPQTCRYCSQRTFCRLNPDLLSADEELEETTENDTGDW